MTKSEKVNIAIQCLKLKNIAGAFKGVSPGDFVAELTVYGIS